MRAIAEKNIEQEHSNFRVGGFLAEAAYPQVIVYHRMQTPYHEFVCAKVNNRMLTTGRRRGETPRGVKRCIRINISMRAQNQLRFIGERSTRIQSSQVTLPARIAARCRRLLHEVMRSLCMSNWMMDDSLNGLFRRFF